MSKWALDKLLKFIYLVANRNLTVKFTDTPLPDGDIGEKTNLDEILGKIVDESDGSVRLGLAAAIPGHGMGFCEVNGDGSATYPLTDGTPHENRAIVWEIGGTVQPLTGVYTIDKAASPNPTITFTPALTAGQNVIVLYKK